MEYRELQRVCILECLDVPIGIKQGLMMAIEEAMYNAAFQHHKNKRVDVSESSQAFLDYYSSLGYGLLSNLKMPGGTQLLDKICKIYLVSKLSNGREILKNLGWVGLEVLITQPVMTQNPVPNAEVVKTVEVRKNIVVKTKRSQIYHCHKCGKNETDFKPLQTRSGDEGYTVFITCVSCNNSWTERG